MSKRGPYIPTRDGYYTVAEAAQILKVTRQAVYQWLRCGEIHGQKLHGHWYIEQDSVESKKASNAAITMMKGGQLHTTPPPGYITAAQAAQALGMSRQNFHSKGYAKLLDRWRISQSTTIYRADDIANLARWRTVRQGMIALGHWPHNTPGVPTVGGFHTAVHEGYWDAECPKCEGEAVGVPDEDRVWCSECGKQNIDDPQATEEDWSEEYESYYEPEEKEVNGYF